jgi:hypothetical protein
MSEQSPNYYLLHVSEDCPWCLRAKALLEHYSASYQTTIERCEEWATVPAIYKVGPDGQELIGGYDQLCALSFEGEL